MLFHIFDPSKACSTHESLTAFWVVVASAFPYLSSLSIYFRFATNAYYRYIPGGRYPLLASAHMTILTAKVAGVPNVIGCTPPIGGKIPNATVAAMHFAGADEIFILGGVQGQLSFPFSKSKMLPHHTGSMPQDSCSGSLESI